MTDRRVITLTTDFGLADYYVAAMKGVILTIAPSARIVDITHEVPAQDIARAAFVLAAVCPYFPGNSVHVAVVDPGVGTARKPIAVATSGGVFVGPDNGTFHDLLVDQSAADPATGKILSAMAVELTDTRFQRRSESTTFHGRDIFAPAAAHLAGGVPLAELGPAIDTLVMREGMPVEAEPGHVRGRIQYIDGFGNAISNIRARLVPDHPVITCAGSRLVGLATDYQGQEISALIGSTGYLEIGVRNGSAHAQLGIRLGDEIDVRSAL